MLCSDCGVRLDSNDPCTTGGFHTYRASGQCPAWEVVYTPDARDIRDQIARVHVVERFSGKAEADRMAADLNEREQSNWERPGAYDVFPAY